MFTYDKPEDILSTPELLEFDLRERQFNAESGSFRRLVKLKIVLRQARESIVFNDTIEKLSKLKDKEAEDFWLAMENTIRSLQESFEQKQMFPKDDHGVHDDFNEPILFQLKRMDEAVSSKDFGKFSYHQQLAREFMNGMYCVATQLIGESPESPTTIEIVTSGNR